MCVVCTPNQGLEQGDDVVQDPLQRNGCAADGVTVFWLEQA